MGQSRAQRMLHGFLRHPEFMTRGLIFSGPAGVGKTTCAYLTARALMCTGNDPLGCGTCPSCRCCDASLAAPHHSLAEHPDFKDLDAASYSGVEHARTIILCAETMPVLGKRRVVLVDEAHECSRPAWDAYLKVLEQGDHNTSYIFSTSESHLVRKSILSRCAMARFTPVDAASIMGRLVQLADEHHIPYDLDGLKRVAALSNGRPRDAICFFGTVAALAVESRLTVELVNSMIDLDVETTVQKVLLTLTQGSLKETIELADPLVLLLGAARTAAALFSGFAREVFCPTGPIAKAFSSTKLVTQCFLKWTAVDQLPNEAIPVLLIELRELLSSRASRASFEPIHTQTAISAPLPVLTVEPSEQSEPAEGGMSPDQAADFLAKRMVV